MLELFSLRGYTEQDTFQRDKTVDLNLLDEFVRYDAVAGVFTWAKTLGSRRAGRPAGGLLGQDAVPTLFIKGERFRCDKAAWYLSHGVWPSGKVRKLDGDATNLRLSNLQVDGEAARDIRLVAVGGGYVVEDRLSGILRVDRFDNVLEAAATLYERAAECA